MSKRQWTTLQPCDRTGKAKRCKQQQHLYLVLDDWERGYSVRRVDVGAFDSDSGADLDSAAEPLPEPPSSAWRPSTATPGPSRRTAPRYSPCSPQAAPPSPSSTSPRGASPSAAGRTGPSEGCRASPSSRPSPAGSTCSRGTTWPRLAPRHRPTTRERRHGPGARSPRPRRSTAAASCPRRRTRMGGPCSSPHRGAPSPWTPTGDSLEWTCQGKWLMPFRGQAYFDGELDAWVGLCRHKGGIGYICCCDIAAADCRTLPAWKLGKDQLFRADSERHLGSTLLYMGNSNYCLIESLARDNEEDLKRLREDHYLPHNRVLYVTTFVLKYDKQGELRTTGRRVGSYEMTDAHRRSDRTLNPVAFWM